MSQRRRKIATPTMLDGDVVLFQSADKGGKLQTKLQRIARLDRRSPAFSHVGLSLGFGLMIHADKPDGVTVVTIFEYDGGCKRDWRVYRHPALVQRLEEWPENAASFSQLAQFFLGQSYEFAMFGDRSGVAFCSELVGRVYELVGLPFKKSPSRLWPIDISAEVLRPPWVEVTGEWRDLLDKPELRKSLVEAAVVMRETIMNTRDALMQHRQMEASLAEFAKTWNIPRLEVPFKYWDDSDT